MPAAPMAADPSPAAMAVDAVPPAAEPGTSQPDAGTGGEQQQQRSEEAAPTPTASQETGDVTLVYKGQEHTFVGVPQRRVPSHPDITTPCTWMCSPCATLARLLRNQAFVVCSPGSCFSLVCRATYDAAAPLAHVLLWPCTQVALLLELLEDSPDFDSLQPDGLSPAEYRQVLPCPCAPAVLLMHVDAPVGACITARWALTFEAVRYRPASSVTKTRSGNASCGNSRRCVLQPSPLYPRFASAPHCTGCMQPATLGM